MIDSQPPTPRIRNATTTQCECHNGNTPAGAIPPAQTPRKRPTPRECKPRYPHPATRPHPWNPRTNHTTMQRHPTQNIYPPKVNYRITRKRSDICSKLTIKLPDRRHWERCGVFIINFELLHTFPSFTIVDFNHANVCWQNYQTLYSFDIRFNVSTGERQNLTRTNVGNSNLFLIIHTTTKLFGTQNRAWDCHKFISSRHFSF